jgi:hypothetical protein
MVMFHRTACIDPIRVFFSLTFESTIGNGQTHYKRNYNEEEDILLFQGLGFQRSAFSHKFKLL